MRHFFFRLSRWAFFLLAVFFSGAQCISFAQNPAEQAVLSRIVTIEGKGPGRITISGERYRVGESTAIFDVKGNRISLCDLLLPCEAEVEYQLIEGQEPLCLRIETRRILRPAGNFVIVDDPG